MSAPSFRDWAVFNVVFQWACSAAAETTPQNPGDPDHPNVRRDLNTNNYFTV